MCITKYFTPCIILFLSFIALALKAPSVYSNSVNVVQVEFDHTSYDLVMMKNVGDQVKVKYFSAPDNYGNSVPSRFNSWKNGRNIILYSSGTYMTDYNQKTPVGLAIDDGIVVNNSIETDKMDALVVILHSGNIFVADLRNTITLENDDSRSSRHYDLRRSALDKSDFVSWAIDNKITVFQAHLLVFDNKLQIASNASPAEEKRRFLAVGKDNRGRNMHIVVQCRVKQNLYDATESVAKMLRLYKKFQIDFMINLDTGGQDIFDAFSEEGGEYPDYKGDKKLLDASNLIIYYYE